MSTVRNYTATYLQLNQVGTSEVVILLMTYTMKYVFQIKQYLNIHVFNMMGEKNESKILAKDIS